MNDRSPRTLDRPLSPAILGLALVAVLAVCALIWRVSAGGAGAAGKDLPVHAGMYDLRASLQKGSQR